MVEYLLSSREAWLLPGSSAERAEAKLVLGLSGMVLNGLDLPPRW